MVIPENREGRTQDNELLARDAQKPSQVHKYRLLYYLFICNRVRYIYIQKILDLYIKVHYLLSFFRSC